MAKVYCLNKYSCNKDCTVQKTEVCDIYETCESLYNAGYRKIPENAVVLMGMETEQRFEDLMVAFDEMGFMPNTTHPFPEEYVESWKQRLIFVFGQLRKETAEKFAERLKADGQCGYSMGIKIYTIEEKGIDEICKEITEGDDVKTSKS